MNAYDIVVDEYMRTSVPGIFAIGDCAEQHNCYTGENWPIMLASTAMAQGRLAGSNLYSIKVVKSFHGVLGTFSTKVGETAIGVSGLTETQAKNMGIDYGGFCGCLADQLMNADEIPLPVDKAGALETALYLARQRQVNLDALADLGFPLASPPSPFDGIPSTDRPPSMTVSIDTFVPTAFLDALSDGEVTMAEARVIAQMPANREMLRFICDRCDGAEPRVSEQTLGYLIWKAGSREPLDRLWRWVNPMNDFGYAGLADHPTNYRELIEDLQYHHQELADAALARVAPFLPHGAEMNLHFAFTPGCLTGDWATPAMSGSDVLRIKAGWEEVVKKVSAGVYRQYLAEQSGGHEGIDRRALVDVADLADERLVIFFDMVVSTVVEGTIEHVSDPSQSVNTPTLMEGVNLVNDLVLQLREESPVESTRALLEQGRGFGGPLCEVGRHLARVVAERDGPLAVTELLDRGCLDLFQRGLEIESESAEGLFDQELIFMANELSNRLDW